LFVWILFSLSLVPLCLCCIQVRYHHLLVSFLPFYVHQCLLSGLLALLSLTLLNTRLCINLPGFKTKMLEIQWSNFFVWILFSLSLVHSAHFVFRFARAALSHIVRATTLVPHVNPLMISGFTEPFCIFTTPVPSLGLNNKPIDQILNKVC
jgi:hypothetical protein